MGSETSPTFTASSAVSRPGTNRPRNKPTTMAAMIHAGSQRSRKDMSLTTPCCAAGRSMMVSLMRTFKPFTVMFVYA